MTNKVEQIEQVNSTFEGNTNSSNVPLKKKKQDTQSCVWCITLNNYTDKELEQLEQWSKRMCKKWVYGKECGEEETPHIQGVFSLKRKLRFAQVKKELSDRYHIEQCISWLGSVRYCMKENNYSYHGLKEHEIEEEPEEYNGEDIIKKEDFYEWQKKCFEFLRQKADCRSIYWIYERTGNTGKSSFAKYMAWHYNTLICQKGKYGDIMNMAFNCKSLKNVIFDIPRSSMSNVSYNAIESIKGGTIINTKYETGQKIIGNVNIVIFSNFPPNLEELSADRWKVYTISKGDLVPEIQAIEEFRGEGLEGF